MLYKPYIYCFLASMLVSSSTIHPLPLLEDTKHTPTSRCLYLSLPLTGLFLHQIFVWFSSLFPLALLANEISLIILLFPLAFITSSNIILPI